MRVLKLSLTEFSLPKFYELFGISKVKSAAVSAFRSSYRPGDRMFAYTPPEQERMALQSLEAIGDALLEIMEVNLSTGLVLTISVSLLSYFQRTFFIFLSKFINFRLV